MTEQQKKYWIVSQVNESTAEILLYGYIDPFAISAADFVKEMRSLEKQYANINVRINSGGGDVFDGFAIYNAIKQSKCNINTYVDGIAGSMASIVSQAGKKRYISQVGQIMTHKPSSGGYGSSDELRKNAELLESLEEVMAGVYATATGKTKEDCKIKFLNGKDNWFNAQLAIAEGLADEMYDADPMELPAAAINEKEIWNSYHTQKFAAKFNQTNNENMKNFILPAAAIAALNIGENADQAAFDAAVTARVNDLVAKATQFDSMKTAKEAAELKLKEIETAATKDKVTAMLSAALTDKKLTKATHDKLAVQFVENPDGLKEVLDTLQPFESIVKDAPGNKTRLQELTAKTWEQLDKSKGELEELKQLSLDAYKAKYKENFKKDFPG